MKEWKKCPNCGYEGMMNCVQALGHSGKKCICPKCDYQIGNL